MVVHYGIGYDEFRYICMLAKVTKVIVWVNVAV